MSKVLAMHQPNLLPWIGFFHKMAQADVFVILDNAQVPQGRSYASRTRIKTSDGVQRLTLPIPRKGTNVYKYQALLPKDQWMDKIWRTIKQNYTKGSGWTYTDFYQYLSYAADTHHSLAAFNEYLIHWARSALNISTQMVRQSDRGVMSDKMTLPARLCKSLECDTYLSGSGARAYNDPDIFKAFGVELTYQQFECPEYPQLWGEFVPNLSIIDLIFNCGAEAGEILCRS